MEAADITVEIPADTRFVALSRVVAASLGSEAGLDVDEIDDLRMAVDELVTLALEATDPATTATLSLRYRISDGTVEVSIDVDGEVDLADHSDELSRLILSSVTDRFELAAGRGHVVRMRGGS